MKLISPSKKYNKSFIVGMRELIKESLHPEFLRAQIENFEKYLLNFSFNEKGEPVAIGKVPYSEYWLIDEEQYIGTIQIRHIPSGRDERIKSHIYFHIIPSKRQRGYGKKILAMGLRKAKILGIREVIVVCDKKNVPSKKIIESNGGIFTEEIVLTQDEVLRKYLIKIV